MKLRFSDLDLLPPSFLVCYRFVYNDLKLISLHQLIIVLLLYKMYLLSYVPGHLRIDKPKLDWNL